VSLLAGLRARWPAAARAAAPAEGDAPARAAEVARLLDPALLARYANLALAVRGAMGPRPGERRFPGHPQPAGIELEAYSAYAPGDDLRHLDWNAVGRLDALLMRRYTAEREVHVHLLVDASASMGAPARDHKLDAARALAIALAYLALATGDAVRIVLLAGDGAPRRSAVVRHRSGAPRLAAFLAGARAAGALDLGVALARYARRHPRPGTALVVSDFMMAPAAVERGVQALAARGYEVHLLHVLGAREREPARDFTRALLADAESDATHPMTLTPAALAQYRALLAAHLEALAAVAERTRAGYARLDTDHDVATFVAVELARRGLVRRR
jgi:uncharacterized protein (DUF58 family)